MPKRERTLAENRGKAAGSASNKHSGAQLTPMQKFNQLARKIVNVPREELRAQQEDHDAANAIRRQQRKRKGAP